MVNGVVPVASYQIKVITPFAALLVKVTFVGAFATPVNVAIAGLYAIFKVTDPTLVRFVTLTGTLTTAPAAEGVTVPSVIVVDVALLILPLLYVTPVITAPVAVVTSHCDELNVIAPEPAIYVKFRSTSLPLAMVNGVVPVASYQIKVITPFAALLVKVTFVGAFATPVNVTTAGLYVIFKVTDPTLVRFVTLMGTLTAAPAAEGVTVPSVIVVEVALLIPPLLYVTPVITAPVAVVASHCDELNVIAPEPATNVKFRSTSLPLAMVNGVVPVASYQIKVITPFAALLVKVTFVGAFATPVNVATAGLYAIFKVTDPTLVKFATLMGTLNVAPDAGAVTVPIVIVVVPCPTAAKVNPINRRQINISIFFIHRPSFLPTI
jgi:Fe-S-cluster formation regulator IscX/YfhJ